MAKARRESSIGMEAISRGACSHRRGKTSGPGVEVHTCTSWSQDSYKFKVTLVCSESLGYTVRIRLNKQKVWWLVPVTPAFGKLGWKGNQEFKTSLGYTRNTLTKRKTKGAGLSVAD